MKCRNGFVSNSSSSSFVIITTAEAHKKALKKIGKEQADLIKGLFYTKKLWGQEFVARGEMSDSGGWTQLLSLENADKEPSNEDDENIYDCDNGCWSEEAFEALEAYAEALGDDCLKMEGY